MGIGNIEIFQSSFLDQRNGSRACYPQICLQLLNGFFLLYYLVILKNRHQQVKELEDYYWFPAFLRNFQTDFIGFVVDRFHVYNVFIEHLKANRLSDQPMTDLCSGSGAPAINIFRQSNCFSRLKLTDKFPNALKIKDTKNLL